MERRKRVLYKLSGESLAGGEHKGISQAFVARIAKLLTEASDLGFKIGVVCGGGNFFRGREDNSLSRKTSDYIGMLGTIMNALALKDAVIREGGEAFIVSSIDIPKFSFSSEPFEVKRRIDLGEIAIFAAGTGHPFFSTDTTAAFRALEMEAEVVLFAKNGTDGVYDKDPNKYPDALKYNSLTMSEIINKNLGVIDQTAASLFKEHRLPVRIFGFDDPENLVRVLSDETLGTMVKGE